MHIFVYPCKNILESKFLGEMVNICYFLFFLAAPLSLQDLCSLTRSQTQAQAVKAQSPNHLATREFFATFFNNCKHCLLKKITPIYAPTNCAGVFISYTPSSTGHCDRCQSSIWKIMSTCFSLIMNNKCW